MEARCSDRYLAAGELLLIDVGNGTVRRVGSAAADVTSLSWTAEGGLLVAALRGLESIVLGVPAASEP